MFARHAGRDAIAPYAREDGQAFLPGAALRAAAETISLFASAYPQLHRAFLDYPKAPHPAALHRFHWARRSVEGRPAFVLGHRIMLCHPAVTVLALRSFYVSRAYDGLDLVVGLIAEEHDVLGVATYRFVTETTRGLANVLRRPLARRQVRRVITEHVAAVRRMAEG